MSRHRRPLAALLVGASVLLGLLALAPPAAPTVAVVVAARDLPLGHRLGAGDLRVVRLAPDTAPAGSVSGVSQLVGQVVRGPLRSGEPVTDVRTQADSLLSGLAPGEVAAPARLADPGAAQLLRPGSLVDVLGTRQLPSGPVTADVVAHRVRVLSAPGPIEQDSGGIAALGQGAGAGPAGGSLIVVAVTREEARAMAAAEAAGRLSVLLLAG